MFQMETTEPAETNTKVYYKHVSGYVIATITTYNTVDRQTDRSMYGRILSRRAALK